MKVKDIVRVCNGELLCGDEEINIKTFSKDTRTIKPGEIYVGIKGERFDGNDYYEVALNNGANALLLSKKIEYRDDNIPIIYVKDTIKALGELASYKRSLFKKDVIGITGSVGKTTTKELIGKVLENKYKILITPDNQNNHIGLPLTILNGEEADIWVIEMGMNNLGEIRYLTNITRPTLSIITNIGTSHIGNLGSRENILKAKLEILEGMEEKKLIINNDNDMLHEYYLNNKDNIITVGIKNKSDYMANIEKNTIDNNDIKLFNNIEPIVLNSLLAYSVGKYFNVETKDIINSIQNYVPHDDRLDIIKKDNYIVISDCYNANYDSMKLAIETLSKYDGRKIAVLGDMFELGSFSKTIHKSVGLLIIENNIDVLLTVGKDSRYIYDTALANGFNKISKHFETKNDVIDYLKQNIKDDDVILVKASNGMNFIEIVNAIK